MFELYKLLSLTIELIFIVPSLHSILSLFIYFNFIIISFLFFKLRRANNNKFLIFI
jgi:hypothetical protein